MLDALSDAKEATRARVVALVKQLASRLDLEEASVRQLEQENAELRRVAIEQAETIAQLTIQLHRPQSPSKVISLVAYPLAGGLIPTLIK